jgi:hypothetical protein
MTLSVKVEIPPHCGGGIKCGSNAAMARYTAREESGMTTASELAAPTVNRQQFVSHLPQTQTRSHEVKEAAKRP